MTTAPHSIVARAPGRVNLLGEHTDYNDGFVLPMALPFETVLRADRRDDATISLRSEGYGQSEFAMDAPPAEVDLWARYVLGMVSILAEEGVAVTGFDADITTTIPVGASLSSSAALEVATGFALYEFAGLDPDPAAIAKAGQRVENEVIGINSGIMDQLISAAAHEGAAMLIDCRSLELAPVRLPADVSVVIMDTMTRRELVDSEYDRRRASCEQASSDIGVSHLRDAQLEDLDRVVDPVDARRARHVVSENQRVLDAVESLGNRDVAAFGELMNGSHDSLRDDYEVSSDALDAIVMAARAQPACLGARMTGGGFAGCAVALVSASDADTFATAVATAYKDDLEVTPDLWIVEPAAGASVRTT